MELCPDKECFIIMPITTPEDYIPAYSNDSEHFLHVLECLFKPAIEKAGFKPILPLMQGSEIIQGEIISNIENSDIVLCDMSILNPNVFFELGIRTALNKPICLIKDSIVEKVPFDTSIINYHTYCPDLSSWITKYEIEKLSNHIKESFSKSNNCNSLWKYFSFKSTATPPEKLNGDTEKIEYLMMQVDAIRRQLIPSEKSIFEPPKDESYTFLGEELTSRDKLDFILKEVEGILSYYGINTNDVVVYIDRDLKGNVIHIKFPGNKAIEIPSEFYRRINHISKKYGINIEIQNR